MRVLGFCLIFCLVWDSTLRPLRRMFLANRPTNSNKFDFCEHSQRTNFSLREYMFRLIHSTGKLFPRPLPATTPCEYSPSVYRPLKSPIYQEIGWLVYYEQSHFWPLSAEIKPRAKSVRAWDARGHFHRVGFDFSHSLDELSVGRRTAHSLASSMRGAATE